MISYIYVQSIKSRKQPANIVSSNQKINDKPITDAKVSEKEIKEAVKSIDENIKIADSLKEGINNTLMKVEGFGGVENVHFTSFVLQ